MTIWRMAAYKFLYRTYDVMAYDVLTMTMYIDHEVGNITTSDVMI